MQVTGYKLQHAIREANDLKNLTASQWDDSLHAFADDKKMSPEDVMEKYLKHERRMVALQVAQAKYNLAVNVRVLDKEMTLCEAIKLVGGAGRTEKMWKAAAGGKKRDRYSYRDDLTRDAGQERAERTITIEAALAQATSASATRLHCARPSRPATQQ